MNCIVDRGNTKTKIYFFKGNELQEMFSFLNENEDFMHQELSHLCFESGIISSSSDLPKFLALYPNKFLILTSQTPVPIELNYDTPKTLGTDRIALVVGANYLYPYRNVLVLSAGTCLTVDLIDKHGVYQGGIISPGLTLRLQSLHTFTKNLPLLELNMKVEYPLLGKSTKESMESGIYNGLKAEVNATIEAFKAIYQDLTVLISGGDANLFDFHSKNKIFAQQNLQAIGLNRILHHNAR